jgi:hypothetical protein
MITEQEADRRVAAERDRLVSHYEARLKAQADFAQIGQAVIGAMNDAGSKFSTTRLNSNDANLISKLAAKYVTMGKHFEVIVDSVKHNTLIRSEWDRFCGFLRLTGTTKNLENTYGET